MAQVSLLIPCLVDQFLPEIGFALIRVLEHLGYSVAYNPSGVCCGQPAFNAGEEEKACDVLMGMLRSFPEDGPIICPSGSCTAMVRKFGPEILHGKEKELARNVSSRVMEFSEFLATQGLIEKLSGRFEGRIAVQNSCHAARELKISQPIRAILDRITGFELVDFPEEAVCCGFGGLFTVKYDSVSQGMARSRLEAFRQSGANAILSNDPGCILHMRKECVRQGFDVSVMHLAEFVAQAIS